NGGNDRTLLLGFPSSTGTLGQQASALIRGVRAKLFTLCRVPVQQPHVHRFPSSQSGLDCLVTIPEGCVHPGGVPVAGGVCSGGQLRPGSERKLCPQRYRVALLVSHLPVPKKLVQAG